MASKQKIKVNPTELRTQANILVGRRSSYAQIHKKILNLALELASVWQGEAADAYVKQLLEMAPLCEAFDDNIVQMVEILRDTAERFEDKDKELGRRFEALD